MHDPSKAYQGLVEENALLKKRIQKLEKSEAEHKRAEYKLHESESRYKMLFTSAAEGILVAELQTKQFIYANPALCKMFGYKEEEVLHLAVEDIHPKEYLEHVMAEFDALARCEKTCALNIPCLHKDGSLFYTNISTTSIVVLGGVKCNVGFFTDITERKRGNEDLYMCEERFRLLSEATFEAIAIHEEGVLLNANDQYFKMFGYEPDEAIGKEMFSLTFDPEVLEFVKKRVATDSLELFEAIGLRKDGTRFPMEIRTRKMEYKGHIVRVGAIRDITERKKVEERLSVTQERLRLALQAGKLGYYD